MRVAFNLKLDLYILAFALQYWGRWRAERREPVDVEWSHIDNMALLCLGRGRITDPPLALLGLGCFLASQKLPAVWWSSARCHLTVPKVFANGYWFSSVSLDDHKHVPAPRRCNKNTDWQGPMRHKWTEVGQVVDPLLLWHPLIHFLPQGWLRETSSWQLQNQESCRTRGPEYLYLSMHLYYNITKMMSTSSSLQCDPAAHSPQPSTAAEVPHCAA